MCRVEHVSSGENAIELIEASGVVGDDGACSQQVLAITATQL